MTIHTYKRKIPPKNFDFKSLEFGYITVREIPIPEGILPKTGISTYSGRVAEPYQMPGEDTERFHIATVHDDGSGWHEIFDGSVELLPEGKKSHVAAGMVKVSYVY